MYSETHSYEYLFSYEVFRTLSVDLSDKRKTVRMDIVNLRPKPLRSEDVNPRRTIYFKFLPTVLRQVVDMCHATSTIVGSQKKTTITASITSSGW